MSENGPEDADRNPEGAGNLSGGETLSHGSGPYKVLGELDASDGAGVLGHNTATSGAAIGVEGVTDSSAGFGLYTPNDARVGGIAELAALAGSLTGGAEVTDLVGDTLAIDGSGALTWTGTNVTTTFSASGTTWEPVSGLSGATAVDVGVDAKDLDDGRVRVEVDGSLAGVVDAGGVYHPIVEATSSVSLTSERFYTFDTSVDVSGEDGAQYGLAFKGDGTRMFTSGTGSGNVYDYGLSTAWDLDSAGYSGNSYDVSGQDGDPIALRFQPDGTKMFVLGRTTGTVYSYDLSTAWGVTSASPANSFAISEEASPRGIAFQDDGTRMFAVGDDHSTVYAYTLSSTWDLTSASYSGNAYDASNQDDLLSAVAFDGSGTRMYLLGEGSDSLYTYELGTAWDVTTAVLVDELAVEGLGTGDIAVKGDATSLYTVSGFDDVVRQYDERYAGTARASVEM